jgi:hypothetical protein
MEYDLLIAEASGAWKNGNPERALSLLGVNVLKDSPEAVFLKGEIHYSLQNWGEALNCFRLCLHLDPDFVAAQTYVDLIMNILSFFHTDHFNP